MDSSGVYLLEIDYFFEITCYNLSCSCYHSIYVLKKYLCSLSFPGFSSRNGRDGSDAVQFVVHLSFNYCSLLFVFKINYYLL